MSLFISSPSQANSAGVYAVEITPPKIIDGVASGVVGLVGQFDWGPAQAVYTPTGGADFMATYEPPGAPRQSTGYRAVKGRKRLSLTVVRVLGAGYANASAAIAGTSGSVRAGAKYPGTLGNSIVVTIAAAASGVATQRDITVSLTDPITGTTKELYSSVPLPTGTQVTVNVASSVLLASLTIDGAMTAWPANGSTNMTTGSNGAAIVSADYVGTQGQADKGCALLETQSNVRVVVHDDCGDTLRSTVNTGFQSHADYMGDRQAVLDTEPDVANWTTVKGEVTGGMVDDRVIYMGAWCTVLDDGGVAVNSPLSTMVASAIINLEPHQSHAWWDDRVTDYYTAINSIVAPFSVAAQQVRADALALGICLPIQLPNGRWAMQHDRNTSQTSGKYFSVRRRTTDYLGLTLVSNLKSYANAPNVVENQRQIKLLVDDFLAREVAKGHITSFSTDIVTPNTPATVALGQFFININATTPAPMEKIFLQMNVGPTVTIAAS